MKAAVLKAPKSKVEFEVREPPSPRRGDVLMHVRACGVCAGDLLLQQGEFPGARYPIVSGHEIAGIVEAIRRHVAAAG